MSEPRTGNIAGKVLVIAVLLAGLTAGFLTWRNYSSLRPSTPDAIYLGQGGLVEAIFPIQKAEKIRPGATALVSKEVAAGTLEAPAVVSSVAGDLEDGRRMFYLRLLETRTALGFQEGDSVEVTVDTEIPANIPQGGD